MIFNTGISLDVRVDLPSITNQPTNNYINVRSKADK